MQFFSPLNFRYPDSTWKPICATGWNETWSDLACNQLGFNGDNETDYPEKPVQTGEKPAQTGFFSLNSTVLPETVLFVQSAAANVAEDSCDSSVNLKCQQFGKETFN
jgi:hypothetical protein